MKASPPGAGRRCLSCGEQVDQILPVSCPKCGWEKGRTFAECDRSCRIWGWIAISAAVLSVFVMGAFAWDPLQRERFGEAAGRAMGSLVFNPATWIFIAAVVTLHNSQVRREKAAEREKRPKPLRWEDRLLAREQEE